MEVKDKIKQRRLERLRHLRESHDAGYSGHASHASHGSSPLPAQQNSQPHRMPVRLEQELPIHADADWRRRIEEDPELAWHYKQRMDSSLHGRNYDDDGERSIFSPPSRQSIVVKLLMSCVLFAAVYGMFHVDHPWATKGKAWVTASLTQSYDFSGLSAWYTDRFGGSPSFIPSFENRGGEDAIKVSASNKRTLFSPVKGSIVTLYNGDTQLGVRLNTASLAPVYALDTGQVIFAGTAPDTGLTIIIRHPNGLQSVYGSLSEAHVEVNDWINRGEAVGKAAKSDAGKGTFYFAVTKDGHPVNPTDVISFD
ncbi:M23 family metallopeptidase [Paenibacillus aestuarii]|uniref:Peptidoglycan DD-metalloendopeptidase family protein n=1 Tax=Paenibacillus aestuarii TaxID=516965 RepID=A0ABW0K1Z4_9BACL|nr:M23 family metallopeptidase [Paenibacillus aestuarii]